MKQQATHLELQTHHRDLITARHRSDLTHWVPHLTCRGTRDKPVQQRSLREKQFFTSRSSDYSGSIHIHTLTLTHSLHPHTRSHTEAGQPAATAVTFFFSFFGPDPQEPRQELRSSPTFTLSLRLLPAIILDDDDDDGNFTKWMSSYWGHSSGEGKDRKHSFRGQSSRRRADRRASLPCPVRTPSADDRERHGLRRVVSYASAAYLHMGDYA